MQPSPQQPSRRRRLVRHQRATRSRRATYPNQPATACQTPNRHQGVAPPGWHAQSRDGSYSFSEQHSGTCSGHGGVQQWNSQWNS
ncbi:MAG: DUF3761 domain-containing protein [Mycobacterium sp.]|uniref:DUF3761 domain-containing protein n=1 Tax=Mycobacterium sp. TaxID=1785 RepID=UPI003F9AE8D3